MSHLHSFYFAIQSSPDNAVECKLRVASIQRNAAACGLTCHTESYGDTVTLQVEAQDIPAAVAFKLAAEQALHQE